MMNDLTALNLIKHGDIKAFESIFRKYYPPLCLYGMSITKRKDISEEIIQDLFYLLWKDRKDIRIFKSLKSYLYRSVYNRSLLYLEHHKVAEGYCRQKVVNNEPNRQTPQEELEYKELEQFIYHTLQNMPERRMNIFRMHRENGLKYSEIAQHIGVSVKTVELEMTKALKQLRTGIENYIKAK